MSDFHVETKPFRIELAALIEKHWETLRPKPGDDDIDPISTAEMGSTWPSGWVLLVSASSIENQDASHAMIHCKPDGQNPYMTIGLMYDALQALAG